MTWKTIIFVLAIQVSVGTSLNSFLAEVQFESSGPVVTQDIVDDLESTFSDLDEDNDGIGDLDSEEVIASFTEELNDVTVDHDDYAVETVSDDDIDIVQVSVESGELEVSESDADELEEVLEDIDTTIVTIEVDQDEFEIE